MDGPDREGAATAGFDREKTAAIFRRHPKLPQFADAGIVTLKAARGILGVDREYMYGIFRDLLEAGAVRAATATSWRATEGLREYLAEIRSGKKPRAGR